MKCTYCGEKIVLKPSASERASKFGGKPSDYTNLFTIHPRCKIIKDRKELFELLDRIAS